MKDWRRALQLREGLLEEVRGILIEVLQVDRAPDELDPDAPLFGSGLGLDSIDALDLVVRVEARFGVQALVPGSSALTGAQALRTLNTLVDKLAAAGVSP